VKNIFSSFEFLLNNVDVKQSDDLSYKLIIDIDCLLQKINREDCMIKLFVVHSQNTFQ
jgi:hypothetical protein